MAQEGAGKIKDTTLRRIAGGAGFNARVESFRFTFSSLESKMGFFERRRERSRLDRIVKSINKQIRRQKADPGPWDTLPGGCVCNLRVAKMGLVRELKTWLSTGRETAPTDWPHLHALRDRPCMLVPVAFPAPVSADPGGGEEPIPVASAIRGRAELGEIDELFRIGETFALKKMVDYLDATERDIALYESRLGTSEGFWAKFSYVLLKKLMDVSVEKNLPVLFA